MRRIAGRLGRQEVLTRAPKRPDVAHARAPVEDDWVARFVQEWHALGGVVAASKWVEMLTAQAAIWEAKTFFDQSGDAVLGAALRAAGLTAAEPLVADVGLARADYAIAETGTLVLKSKAGLGRQASLLPPAVVLVVKRADVYPTRTALFAHLAEAPLPHNISLVTGASRSSDIAGETVIGVHGPGRVMALVTE